MRKFNVKKFVFSSSATVYEEKNEIPYYVVRVASCELKQLSVFGNNYPTPDGTSVSPVIPRLPQVKRRNGIDI